MSEVTLECLHGRGGACRDRGEPHLRARAGAGGAVGRRGDAARRLRSALPRWTSWSAPRRRRTRCSPGTGLRRALPGGPRKPLCIIDIAIPRDVEPAVGRRAERLPLQHRRPAADRGRQPGPAPRELPAAEAIITRGWRSSGPGTRRWRWFPPSASSARTARRCGRPRSSGSSGSSRTWRRGPRGDRRADPFAAEQGPAHAHRAAAPGGGERTRHRRAGHGPLPLRTGTRHGARD
jgi:hypothetical protein